MTMASVGREESTVSSTFDMRAMDSTSPVSSMVSRSAAEQRWTSIFSVFLDEALGGVGGEGSG